MSGASFALTYTILILINEQARGSRMIEANTHDAMRKRPKVVRPMTLPT